MTGMQAKYSELLIVSVKQLFYENKVCRSYKTEPVTDFMLIPSEESLEVIKRMDLIFKNTGLNGGFTVLAHTSGKNADDNEVLRFPARKDDKLSILMIAKNPEIINYNDLPLQIKRDEIYYFSNLVTDNNASRKNLHLSKDVSGVKKEDCIKKVNENYIFKSAAQVLPGTAKVKHLLSAKEVEPKSVMNNAGAAIITFDLLLLPSGKCELLVNNVVKDEFYYLKSTSFPSVFGVIEISLSDALMPNYRVIEPGRSLMPDRPLYKLQFRNRQTLWRYTVKLNTSSPLYLEMAALSPADRTEFIQKLNITEQSNAITFARESATDTGFVFVSTVPLFLKEKYYSSSGISLVLLLKKYVGDSREAVVKPNLPYPSTESVNALNPPNVYSDLFITI